MLLLCVGGGCILTRIFILRRLTFAKNFKSKTPYVCLLFMAFWRMVFFTCFVYIVFLLLVVVVVVALLFVVVVVVVVNGGECCVVIVVM